MMSNNADLVSLNQTIRHWKKMLNEKSLRYLSVSSCEGLVISFKRMYVFVQKRVLKFEFITFCSFFDEKSNKFL